MTEKAGRNLTLATAVADVDARFEAANPKSKAQFDRARRSMPGGNTRSVLYYDPFPVTIRRADGVFLQDADGHEYCDFLGEYTAGLYGHSHPKLIAAMNDALAAGVLFGGPNANEARLAELMCARFPSLDQVRFCNSGTEANLMALSLARYATGREKILVFRGGYHGGVFYYGGEGSPINVPFPTVFATYNDIDGTAALIDRHQDDLAAVILEPMLGSGGAISASTRFLQMLRDKTSAFGITLIFDEVMTSRLAPGGLQGKLGIVPDLTSFGKYLGGGGSFGAFGGRGDFMCHFDPSRSDALPHSGTYNNNVLTMAAGAVGLSEVFTPEAAVALNQLGDRLKAQLNAVAEAAGVPMQVTGDGSILCVHFQRGKIETPDDIILPDPALRRLFHLEMLMRGFYLARRGFISLALPHEPADCDRMAAAFEDFVVSYRSILTD